MKRAFVATLVAGGLMVFVFTDSTQMVFDAVVEEAGLVNAALLEEITSEAVMIRDVDSSAIIYERDPDTVRPIASVTKLFTAHITSTSPMIDMPVSFTWSDLSTEGDSGGFTYGDTYTARELLFPVLLVSSNDAAVALQRHIGPTIFSEEIAALKEVAHLPSTHIEEATGLSSENRSTARELSEFMIYLEKSDPHILDITSLRSYLGREKGWMNNDPARTLEGFRGGKHGYTPEAGKTFAGIIGEGEREYVVVLLDSADILADLEVITRALP